MLLTLTLTLTLNLTLSLILTLTRTAACGNNFPVRRIFHYNGLKTVTKIFNELLQTLQTNSVYCVWVYSCKVLRMIRESVEPRFLTPVNASSDLFRVVEWRRKYYRQWAYTTAPTREATCRVFAVHCTGTRLIASSSKVQNAGLCHTKLGAIASITTK